MRCPLLVVLVVAHGLLPVVESASVGVPEQQVQKRGDARSRHQSPPRPRAPVPRPSRLSPAPRPPLEPQAQHTSASGRADRARPAVSGMLGAHTAAVKRQMTRPDQQERRRLAAQARRRPQSRSGTGRGGAVARPRAGHPQVREELPDHDGIVQRGDRAQPAPTMDTRQDIYVRQSTLGQVRDAQPSRPTHSTLTCVLVAQPAVRNHAAPVTSSTASPLPRFARRRAAIAALFAKRMCRPCGPSPPHHVAPASAGPTRCRRAASPHQRGQRGGFRKRFRRAEPSFRKAGTESVTPVESSMAAVFTVLPRKSRAGRTILAGT